VPGTSEFDVADPVLRGLLGGLLTANWRSLCLFTGRYRWRGFDKQIGQNLALEIHLPQLSLRQAVMLMDNLPRLKRQPIATKIALFHKVGGHPKTLELLEGWLAQGRLTDLLDDAALDSLLTPEWEAYFLDDLLARLSPAERERLARLAIFQDELDEEALAYAAVTEEMAARWLDLSLLQQVGGGLTCRPTWPGCSRCCPRPSRPKCARSSPGAACWFTRWWPTTCWGRRTTTPAASCTAGPPLITGGRLWR
jgi:hypothetical protein